MRVRASRRSASRWLRFALFGWLACASAVPAFDAVAQPGGAVPPAAALVKISAEPVTVPSGDEAVAKIRLTIAPGWHINANPPFPDYMISTELTISSGDGIVVGDPTYPPPHFEKLGFDESELHVYDGTVEVLLPLRSIAGATGTRTLKGTLRFQACNNQVCLPPHTLPVTLPLSIAGGSAVTPPAAGVTRGGAATDSTANAPGDPNAAAGDVAPPPAPGFTTARGQAGVDNPIARAMGQGSFAAFLTLFLIGLALNLTPCVYPMLGVTVSIFGARGSATALQAFGMALIYVMGISIMYSSLGLVAAFSGGLFGAALQNPYVLVVIGMLFIVLSLSMFGLYELQLPPGLMMKLGGRTTTGALGVFGSGLLVGVFAAPCIGPPIVALLAIVGAKGDPLFGFSSFFVLSLGLGAPYLVLGTFSNLLQRLPRSGEWMVWVKKVFGLILFAVGAFYAMLAVAPRQAVWVAPVALLIGGVYLGFVEKSKGRTATFLWLKRVTGAAAVVAGVYLASAALPAQSVAFREFDPGRLNSALRTGRVVLMDFSADWCVPCHELERFTFTDDRVIDAARQFETLKVDLTHYDSPESERLRRAYGITGVPTVVFLAPNGREVNAARVEGFLPPEVFLQRMQLAAAAGQRAER